MSENGNPSASAERPWTDPALHVEERVAALLAAMTTDEKLAQLGSAWFILRPEADGGSQPELVPYDHAHSGAELNYLEAVPQSVDEVVKDGIGHLTRVFGTRPVDAVSGARALARVQRHLIERTRLGVPATAHEECLAGLTAHGATAFPTPLACAATFNADAVRDMARMIGTDMRRLGVHQGLAPVLDVVRDYRWGRVEETFGEDPYLIGVLGSAYVSGLQSAGILATLKHFAGYSASIAARNLAPVSIGPRELRDVILQPFEMVLRHGGARGVMLAYTSIDGVPPAADPALPTTVLRDEWGFDGVVVSDYYGISFLESQQQVAESPAAAARLALRAGVDVELPASRCYGAPLKELLWSGEVPEELLDRSVARVLRQKAALGLLDAGWDPTPAALTSDAPVDLDAPAHRAHARRLAEQSVVLVKNDGILPLRDVQRIAVVGPVADDPYAFLGCYSFPNHVGARYPEAGMGLDIPSVLSALRAEYPDVEVTFVPGCDVSSDRRDGFAVAVEAVRAADVCVAVLGDRSGLFGEGTSGEGSDAANLGLPGVQEELLSGLLATGTRTVLAVISGRPYAVGDLEDRLGAWLQAFFPGEEAGAAVAGVVSGRVTPSGRLPVQIPRRADSPAITYLHSRLAEGNELSVLDSSPAYPFGHGLGYTTFTWSDLSLGDDAIPTDGETTVGCTVRNSGDRAGVEVVQLYLTDPVASVTRPVRELVDYARVELGAGEAARVTFTLHAERTSFTGTDLRRVVEPGVVELRLGRSALDTQLEAKLLLTGPERHPSAGRVLLTPVDVRPATR